MAGGEQFRSRGSYSLIFTTLLSFCLLMGGILFSRLAESQSELTPILGKLAESSGQSASDEITQAYLRNIETYLSRIHEDLGPGRADTVQEIRNEIRLLARTIAALAEEPER